MSCNRDNVTWQTEDGRWSIGFWNFYNVNEDDPDWDYEWDVEYTWDGFWWCSTGHASEEDAYEAYCRQHANPGGTDVTPWSEENRAEIEQLNALAAKFKAGN